LRSTYIAMGMPPSVHSISHLPREIIVAHTMASNSAPPLLKAEVAVLSFSASKDGKLRVTYTGWDDAKVALEGQEFVVIAGSKGVEARIRDRKRHRWGGEYATKAASPSHQGAAGAPGHDSRCVQRRGPHRGRTVY
jgi:hypothetical protein